MWSRGYSDELYKESSSKLDKLRIKIKETEMARIGIEAQLHQNSTLLKLFSDLPLNAFVEDHLDKLHAANATLRHNLEEKQIAIERHESALEVRLNKYCECLPMELILKLDMEHQLAMCMSNVLFVTERLKESAKRNDFMVEFAQKILRAAMTSEGHGSVLNETLISLFGGKTTGQRSNEQIAACTEDVDVFYDSATDVSDTESLFGILEKDEELNKRNKETVEEDEMRVDENLLRRQSILTSMKSHETPKRRTTKRRTPNSSLISTAKKGALQGLLPQDVTNQETPMLKRVLKPSCQTPKAPGTLTRSLKRSRRDSMLPVPVGLQRSPLRDASFTNINTTIKKKIRCQETGITKNPASPLCSKTSLVSQGNPSSRRMSMLPVAASNEIGTRMQTRSGRANQLKQL